MVYGAAVHHLYRAGKYIPHVLLNTRTHARMQIREHRTQRYIMGTVYVVFNAASKNRQQKFSQKNG